MPTSLFKRLDGDSAPSRVTIELDGAPLTVAAGCSVAAALLDAGVARFRTTPVSDSPRAPYCMMGVCFECLMEIDGVPNRQTCLVQVRDGMQLRTQHGARDLQADTAEVHHAG